MILLAMFGHPSAENGVEVRQIGDINDSIDALSKRRQRIVGRKEMAEQDNEMLASFGSRCAACCFKSGCGCAGWSRAVLVSDGDLVRMSVHMYHQIALN